MCNQKQVKNDIRTAEKGRSTSSISSSLESGSSNGEDLKQIIMRCFDKFDLNNDGFLDLPEVRKLIKFIYEQKGKCKSEQFYRKASVTLMETIDVDHLGKISRADFYKFYKNC